jgi:hypothetical protein
MEEALRTWSEFNVAMVGAAAALAGLVIVAASVNIAKIIALGGGSLIARLAAGIASLVLALVASGLALIPGITAPWFGVILIVATAGSAAFQVHAAWTVRADHGPAARAKATKSVPGFLPVIAYLAAGIAVLAGHPAGLYLSAAGCILAIIAAILVSWVALVEVLR